ncbi:MAG TPA: ABC transporter ATP-binding protein [Gaiellaceae bacterium]
MTPPTAALGAEAPAAPARGTIRLTAITKHYGDLVALDRVDFDVEPGEIHALLGENGAGKTTLMSIMFGFIPLTSGEISIGGEPVDFESPRDALDRGIGMVHQHFMLVPNFTVAENVVLGTEAPTRLRFDPRALEAEVRQAAHEHSMGVAAEHRIADLPIDARQRVEILKLLYRGATTLILDEPTSALGPAQIENLFSTLRELRDNGHSVVIVTHKLAEVMDIADRVTVLKGGKNAAEARRGEFDERFLARAMTGRDLEELPTRQRKPATEAVLRVREVVVHGQTRLEALNGITVDAHPYEILGVAGVEGNGQRELADVIAGVRAAESGTIEIAGLDITHLPPLRRHEAGLAVVPEDRHAWGLVLDMTLAENLALASVPEGEMSRFGLLRRGAMKRRAAKLLEEFDVRPPDPNMRAIALSGGNQQKVVLAREISRKPRVLIAANPTNGLDVGAAEFVHRRLLEVREAGSAVILISNELDELLELSDRVIVLYRGRIAYDTPIETLSMDELAYAMAGRRELAGSVAGPEAAE